MIFFCLNGFNFFGILVNWISLFRFRNISLNMLGISLVRPDTSSPDRRTHIALYLSISLFQLHEPCNNSPISHTRLQWSHDFIRSIIVNIYEHLTITESAMCYPPLTMLHYKCYLSSPILSSCSIGLIPYSSILLLRCLVVGYSLQ